MPLTSLDERQYIPPKIACQTNECLPVTSQTDLNLPIQLQTGLDNKQLTPPSKDGSMPSCTQHNSRSLFEISSSFNKLAIRWIGWQVSFFMIQMLLM